MSKKFLRGMLTIAIVAVMTLGANIPLSFAETSTLSDDGTISASSRAGNYIEGTYLLWHGIDQWPKFGTVFSEYEYYEKVLGRPGGTHDSLLKVGDSFILPLTISGVAYGEYFPNGDSGTVPPYYNWVTSVNTTLDSNKWSVTNSNVLKITKYPDAIKVDCIGAGSSYLRYTATNVHSTWKDVVVNVDENPVMPKIISTNVNDVKTSVEVRYSDDGTGCLVGWSLENDVATVETWIEGKPLGTMIENLPTDVPIFVFVKDEEGHVIRKNAGAVPGILTMPITQGETVQLAASYDFSDNVKLIWSSSDEQVATVDSNGNITGINRGIAYITARNASNTFNKSIPVRVMNLAPTPEEGIPTVTEVQISAEGARIIGDDDKGIVEYGISATTDSSAATWKKSNIFANVKPGATYYAFVKDGEGNISEPYAFKKPIE